MDEFRHRLREWLAAREWPPVDVSTPEGIAAAKAFQAELHAAGFAGLTWPVEYGGQGLGTAAVGVFGEESARYPLPTYPFMISMGMCGPTIVDLGTPAQKERYLPPLLSGAEIWCQLFSEPGAGSDVASLSTSAVRDGDEWIVNGQKVWTSGAQNSQFGALLARTNADVPKHRGLTMFVVDMTTPGVTVRPLRDMTGRAPFNEVFLDGVRLPADAVLGEVDKGWTAALVMLGHERVSLGGSSRSKDDPLAAVSLVELARRHGRLDDPLVRDRLAEVHAAEKALELFNARLREEMLAGLDPGARGSVGKLSDALLQCRKADTAGMVAGADAVAWPEDDPSGDVLARALSYVPAFSIAGGSNQIQRNIIGERILGLPKGD